MAPRKLRGDNMADDGLDEKVQGHEPLAKSGDHIDWDRLKKALEILENWSPERLSKAQAYKIQYKAGLVHHQLQRAIHAYVTRPRGGGNVNSGNLEKVHHNNGTMDDAGLDADKKLVIPEVGTKDKFVKTTTVDAFGEEIEHK
jgi:hypothetical protein